MKKIERLQNVRLKYVKLLTESLLCAKSSKPFFFFFFATNLSKVEHFIEKEEKQSIAMLLLVDNICKF